VVELLVIEVREYKEFGGA